MIRVLFYENYLGGSDLTSGSAFGRKAAVHAAEYAKLGTGKKSSP
jgi:succinate dehydrogenase/fumarate reductase flavoprotein subunit